MTPFFKTLVTDVGGSAFHGSAAPGQVVLDYIQKQAEQATGDEPVSSTPPWCLHQCLPTGSCLASPQ